MCQDDSSYQVASHQMHRGNFYWLLLRISRFNSHDHEQLIMAGGESTLARNNLLSCNLDSKMHVILLFEVRFPWSSTRNAANNVNFQRLHEPACDLAESQRNQLWVLRLCRFFPSFTTGCEGGYLAPDADFSTMVLAMWAASFLCYFEVRLILSLYYSHRANEKNQDYFPLDLPILFALDGVFFFSIASWISTSIHKGQSTIYISQ